MSARRVFDAFAAAALIGAPCARAQGVPADRVAVTLSAGYGVTSRSFSQNTTFELFSEDGTMTSSYTVRHAPLYEAGATARLWRNFGAGVAFSSARQNGPAQVVAQIPDPFQFNQFHQISGAPGVQHNETAVHAQAAFWFTAGKRLDVIVSGGPSFFSAQRDFVSDVTYEDTFPYNSPAYQAATLTRARKRATGVNLGAEGGWRFASHFAVAAVARYSRATADFGSVGGQSVELGGLHVGGGIRLLF
jgi:hypothetical protein